MQTTKQTRAAVKRVADTGCCPRFDPAQVPDGEFVWNDKLFVAEQIHSLFHVPLDMTRKVKHAGALILAAGAQPSARPLMLGEEISPWRSNVYLEVTHAVPEANMMSLSGTFLAKVFQGPFGDSSRWVREMGEHVASRGEKIQRLFFGYTTCPRCARAYGENYVVLYAKIDSFARHATELRSSLIAPNPICAYDDRAHAGRVLADIVEGKWWQDLLVVAIARGGVPVAAEIARRLGAELDVVAPRKIGAPGRPELTLGVVCADGSKLLDEAQIRGLGLSQDWVDRAVEREAQKARERELRWRCGPASDPTARSVLLVDDGSLTGATLRACAAVFKRKEVRVLAAAVPVASRQCCEDVAPFLDALICPLQPETVIALGHHYRAFPQLSDREVQHALIAHRTWLHDLPGCLRA